MLLGGVFGERPLPGSQSSCFACCWGLILEVLTAKMSSSFLLPSLLPEQEEVGGRDERWACWRKVDQDPGS